MPRKKTADYIGKEALEKQRERIEAGDYPFALIMVGLKMEGKPIDDYAPDFWLVSDKDGKRCGYVTSPWWSPELQANIALARVPWNKSEIGTELMVELPEPYAEVSGEPVMAEVCEVPFIPSAHSSAREQAKAKGRDSAD